MTNFKDLVLKTRSYRRFDQSYKVESGLLEDLIGLARLSPSAANMQPLKYLLYNTPKDCERIFPSLAWAGYLEDWDGPAPGERPSAYIIILGDTSITGSFNVDHGIAAQTIMLGASEAGLGGCMIGSIKREQLRKELGIPSGFNILLVLALGKPVEKIVIDEAVGSNIKYWREGDMTHHVPKRPLDELLINL
ncbi:MAG: nitroreductase family protein [Bacteroidales bacterium]|jgi:nitroreductase